MTTIDIPIGQTWRIGDVAIKIRTNASHTTATFVIDAPKDVAITRPDQVKKERK